MSTQMYNVLDSLRKIENPSEDILAAIEQTAKMTSVTGDNVYNTVAESTLTIQQKELYKLAGVPVLVVNENVTVDESIPTRKEFEMVADLIKGYSDPVKRKELAQHHAAIYKTQNPRFDHDKFMSAAGVDESTEDNIRLPKDNWSSNDSLADPVTSTQAFDSFSDYLTKVKLDPKTGEPIKEEYDATHVADIIKRHKDAGHGVEVDPYKDNEAGFTITEPSGRRRHYNYTNTGVKVTSLEPIDAEKDPNAPARGRGRPRLEEGKMKELSYDLDNMTDEEFEDNYKMTKEEMRSELTQKDEAVMENFEEKFNELLTETIQVTTSIEDDGKKNVTIAASGDHAEELASLLRLSGMRSSGYQEVTPSDCGAEEPVAEELANSPDPKYADVETQLVKMSGGVNGPKRQINPNNNAGDNSLAMKKLGRSNISLNLEESLWDLYKEFKV